jgi:tryptophan-rich sensory protein
MKFNYFAIPVITIFVALVGGVFTSQGLQGWYGTLVLPAIAPKGEFIGMVWTILYAMTALAAILVYNNEARDSSWLLAIAAFLLNALLNIFWSFLFFDRHFIGLATFEAALLGLSVLLMIVFSWRLSKTASILLMPYLAWVLFATYLCFLIYRLNP